MLFIRPDKKHIANFKVELNLAVEMLDLRPLHHYLGIQFLEHHDGIALVQTKYIGSLLHHFDFKDCRTIDTPMETCLHLNVHDIGKCFDVVLYQ